MTGRAAWALCAAIAVLVAAPAASPRVTRMPKPRTLAVVPGDLHALAQGPKRLALLRGSSACPQAEIVDLRTHRRVRVSSRRSNRTGSCAGYLVTFGVLAFDGNRVLWQMHWASNQSHYVEVLSAALNDRRTRSLGGGSYDNYASDFWGPLPMAGIPGRLVFYQYDECNDEDCVFKDGVRAVVGRWSRRLFAAEGIVGIALGGRRLTLLETPGAFRHYTPAWSPDGKTIAWTDERSGVDLANSDGSGRRVLAEGGSGPSWAPDSSRLAFSSPSESGSLIEIVNADGSGRRTLTSGSGPQWSPDGTKVAFVRGNPADVYRIDVDGTQETRLTNHPYGEATARPRWSPDGTKLLVERGDQIYVVDAVTGSEELLAPQGALSTSGLRPSPAWSPDGTKIAFTHPGGGPPYVAGGSLAVMNADGTHVRVLKDEGCCYAADVDPAWSSDGSKIAFEHRDTDNFHGDVRVVNSDGTAERGLGRGAAPAWAPGASTVAWGDGSKDGTGLVIANADASRRKLVAGDVYHSPIVVRLARTGALVKSFESSGLAVGVAMSGNCVAVVEREGESKYQLRRYRLDGKFLGSRSLPKGVSSVMGGATAFVYAARGSIFAVDARTGRATVIARPVAFAGGLSILNRRVIWAESAGRNRNRIQAINLPG